MQNNRLQTSRSVGRNVVFGFSTWVLPLVLTFVATPRIIRALGDGDYGIYALVLGFVGYSFNFSFGRAVTKYIAEYRASGETEKIADIISAAFFINVAVGLTSVFLVCISAGQLVEKVFAIEAEAQGKTVVAFYIAASIIFFSMQNQIFSSILQGIHRFDVYSKIFNLNNFALIAGNLLLAVSGYGLLALLLWNSAVALITCLIFAFAAQRHLPQFRIKLNFRGGTSKLIVRYSAGVIGYQILSNFLLLFERGLLTRNFGAKSLTYYVVPMTLAIYIHGFISSLVLVIFPLASELKSEPERLLRLYTKATKIVCLFVFFLGTSLIVESRLFLTLWMGESFALQTYKLLIIHTITFSFVAIQTVSWQLTEGLGYPNYNCYLFVICLIISVFLMIYLPPVYNLSGFALGRMFGYLTIFLSVFYVEKWFFGAVQYRFWLKIFGVLTISSVAAAIIEGAVIGYLWNGWICFLTAGIVGAVVYGLIIWILGFVSEDEIILFRRIFLSPQLKRDGKEI